MLISVKKILTIGCFCLTLVTSQGLKADWTLPPTDVSSVGDFGDENPRLGMSLNGNMVLSWFNGTTGLVNANTVAAGSTVVSASTVLSSSFAGATTECDRNNSGQAVVVWYGVNGPQRDIFASYYNGASWIDAPTGVTLAT